MLPNIELLQAGTHAPNFEVERLDGEKVSLATFAQQKVALMFVAPTCSHCIEKLPEWEALGPKMKQKGVDLVLVSLADTEATRAFAKEYSIQLPVLTVPSGDSAFITDYKVMGTPQYCVINEQGKVQAAGFLGKEWDQLVEGWTK